MSKSTISTFELFKLFPDQEAARVYLEARLWPEGPRCPCCWLGERITARAGGFYRCNQCKEDFTVRTGTIFERSHVPLHKWVYSMYLLVTAWHFEFLVCPCSINESSPSNCRSGGWSVRIEKTIPGIVWATF